MANTERTGADMPDATSTRSPEGDWDILAESHRELLTELRERLHGDAEVPLDDITNRLDEAIAAFACSWSDAEAAKPRTPWDRAAEARLDGLEERVDILAKNHETLRMTMKMVAAAMRAGATHDDCEPTEVGR